MGFFDKLFGSKKGKEDVKVQENKEVKLEEKNKESNIESNVQKTEDKEVRKMDDNELVISILEKKISGMNFKVSHDKKAVIISDVDTTVQAVIKGKNKQGNISIVQMDFVIDNEQFGEEGIFESLAGSGKDIEEAINNCIDIFIKSVFGVVIKSLKDNSASDLDIETNKKGIERTWHAYMCNIKSQEMDGSIETGDARIYNLLKNQIVKRLKSNKFYWVKVWLTRQIDGKLMYQCLLNNKPFLEAERALEDYAKKWAEGADKSKGYIVEMQYIIIRQSEKSYNENRQKDIENENFMKKCAEYAIDVFGDFEPKDSVESLVNKIAEFTKDINLAWEFFWFIPAIYCRLALSGPKYTDTVILVLSDDRRIFGKLYDYDAYVIGVDTVIKKLQANQSQEKIQKILFLSDEFKTLQKLLKEGKEAKDLKPVPMVLMAPRSYVVTD